MLGRIAFRPVRQLAAPRHQSCLVAEVGNEPMRASSGLDRVLYDDLKRRVRRGQPAWSVESHEAELENQECIIFSMQ